MPERAQNNRVLSGSRGRARGVVPRRAIPLTELLAFYR